MHICYKLFGWKPWTFLTNYDIDRECEKCPVCGGTSFKHTVVDTVSNHASEVHVHCDECGEMVNCQLYGSYDPIFMYMDRSFEMWVIRKQKATI